MSTGKTGPRQTGPEGGTGTEPFLSRWSRRKQLATATKEAPPAQPTAKEPIAERGSAAPAGSVAATASRLDAQAFDPTTLPAIESITAETDIRAFLSPGVPPALRREALRRAWVADPKIRDFVGLAEYAWDFNAPGSMPGFGPLAMTDELRRMVAQIVGDVAAPEPPAPAPVNDPDPPAVLPEPSGQTAGETAAATAGEPQGSPEAATAPRLVEPEACDESPLGHGDPAAVPGQSQKSQCFQRTDRRSHGRALPKS